MELEMEFEEEGGSGSGGVGRSLAGVSVLTNVIDPALSLLVVESLSVLYRAFRGDGNNGDSESNALSLSPPCGKQQRGAFVPRPQSYKEKNQGRDMMHFGAYVHNNRLQDAQPMPFTSEIHMACAALVKAGAMPYDTWADACTVGMYEEGSWLPPHEDSRAFERPIVILSLLSDEQEMTFGQVDNLGEYREKARIRMPARSATIIDALRLNPTPSSGVFHHGTHHGIMHLPGGCGKGELTSYRNSLQVCVLWIVVYCLSASSFSRSSIGSVNTLSTALSREPAFRMFGQARLFQRDASRDVVTL